jgi:hypothetical protein
MTAPQWRRAARRGAGASGEGGSIASPSNIPMGFCTQRAF